MGRPDCDTGLVPGDVLDLRVRVVIIRMPTHQMFTRGAAPVYASSLIDQIRCHLGTVGREPCGARRGGGRCGRRYRVGGPTRRSRRDPAFVDVAGNSAGREGRVRVFGSARDGTGSGGWDQRPLTTHGTRRNPVTGLHEPPSASTLGRLAGLLDADELETRLYAWTAPRRAGPAACGPDRGTARHQEGE